MSRWVISVPIWGPKYVTTFLRVAVLPLLAAVDRLNEPVRFIIHTDAFGQTKIKNALAGRQVEFREVGPHPTYVALQKAHADAVRSAQAGERVVLLNADLVISGNFLTRCREHFTQSKQAIVLLGIRTAAGPDRPPVNAGSRELLQWAWAHRHQIIKDLEWPHGKSLLLTNVFFSSGQTVVARGFHLHPAAIIKHDGIKFQSTIDGDLLDYFPRDVIHVVTNPDDCSMLEVSPPERRFPVRAVADALPMTPTRIAVCMRTRASAMHCWLVGHRIGVVGDVQDCGDEVVINNVLATMGKLAVQPRKRVTRGVTAHGRRGSKPIKVRLN